MSRPQVHQLLAALSYGDAIGNASLAIQSELRAMGFDSEIFAEKVHPQMAGSARPLWEYRRVSSPDTVCLFHFSIRSAAGRFIFSSPDRLVCIYHNITPAHFFFGFHPHLAGLCYHGRRELARFAKRTELALGVSEFNRRELQEVGFSRTAVLPFPWDPSGLSRARPNAIVRQLYGDGRTNILFVGRIIPNKKIEDVIASYALYVRHYDPKARLLLVGDYRGHERYFDSLQELIKRWQLSDVVFAGHVDQDELRAYYSVSSLFLCLSEHEGFGVPLQEAMMLGLPVIAYDAAAVRETLHGGGLLISDKSPAIVAELMHQVLNDETLRARILESQAAALREIRSFDFGASLRAQIEPLLQSRAHSSQ